MLNNLLTKIDFLGKFEANNSRFHNLIEEFAILPSIKNPHWLIPLKNKELIVSSLALYQPSLVRAKLLKKMTVLVAKGGLSYLLMKNRVYFQRDDRAIKEIFNRDDLYYAFFTGTEGCHRKVTIQVMDEKGRILGYIKVSDNGDIDRLLRNEKEILEDLSRLNIENGLVPKVVYHGRINDVNILVLDTLKSVHSKFGSNLSNIHIKFLAEIFRKTMRHCKFGESGFACNIRQRLREFVTNRQRNAYEKAADYIEKKIKDKDIPFGLCHRDFTPWNTFFHNGKLYVFDWEYARRDYPPLIDLFHFMIQDGILVRHLKPEGLLRRVFKRTELVETYCNLISISTNKDFLVSLLLCYLLDISLFYIEREKGVLTTNTAISLNIWKEMMDVIIGGS